MKNLSIFTALILLISSCNMITGNGNIRTENRNTGNFTAVKTSGSIDIEISSGPACAVSVEDDDNILPYILTEVDDGTLNIRYQNGIGVNNDHAKVYITAPSLDELSSSGSADIILKDQLKNAGEIKMHVSGSGSIKGQVNAPSLDISVSGSGGISLSGQTKDLTAGVSGSGDLNCGNLLSENTTVRVSGSGNAHVFASVHLSASVSGSGDVFYQGNPSNPEIHASGSGSVQAGK